MARNVNPEGLESIGAVGSGGGQSPIDQPGSAPLTAADAGHPAAPGKKEPKRLSRGQIIARRFLRNKTAVAGAVGFVLVLLMALFGSHLGAWSYTEVDKTAFLAPPSAEHWFGTTQGGRDVFALVVEGTRKSMLIGVCVALLQTGIAAVIGSSAAYFGGWWERIAL